MRFGRRGVDCFAVDCIRNVAEFFARNGELVGSERENSLSWNDEFGREPAEEPLDESHDGPFPRVEIVVTMQNGGHAAKGCRYPTEGPGKEHLALDDFGP